MKRLMTLAMLLGLTVVLGCEPKPVPKTEAPKAENMDAPKDDAAPSEGAPEGEKPAEGETK